MGGGVVLQFALQFPDKLDKMFLVDSSGLGKEMAFAFRLIPLPLIGELLSRPSLKGIEQSLKACVYDKTVVTDEQVESYFQLASVPGW